ncbi:MAG: 50S ribosomal protein L13, partial [Bacilli bacterium]|nr:50S ribosomal protein L13 [Bacilli bacterium]
MDTFMAKKSDVIRNWYVIDAEGKNLGRVASKAATILRGKHKAIYTPHVDCGDYVIIINAEKVNLTGNKLDQKMYYNHSGYPGGLR